MRQTANIVNITIQQCLARGMICSQLHRTVIAASSNTFSKILPSSICTIPQFQILIIQLSNMSLAKIMRYASQAHLGSHFDTVFVWLLLSVADSSFVVVTGTKQYALALFYRDPPSHQRSLLENKTNTQFQITHFYTTFVRLGQVRFRRKQQARLGQRPRQHQIAF